MYGDPGTWKSDDFLMLNHGLGEEIVDIPVYVNSRNNCILNFLICLQAVKFIIKMVISYGGGNNYME